MPKLPTIYWKASQVRSIWIVTFQSFQEHSNKWSIGCPSLFPKSGSSIYEIVPQAAEKKRVIDDEENQSNFPEDAKWASSKRPQPGWPGWMRAKRIVLLSLWQWNQRPTSWFYEKTFQYKASEKDQDQNAENAPENGDRPSKNSTAEQKRERQGSQRTKAQPSDPTQSPKDI